MSMSSPLGWPAVPASSLPPRFRSVGSLGWPTDNSADGDSAERVPRETAGLVEATVPREQPVSARDVAAIPRPETDVDPGDSPAVARVAGATADPPVPRETGDDTATDAVPRETQLPPAATRAELAASRPWSGTRVVTVSNQKGGVGKTTTAVNIAAAMALEGLRVLVIDMDPQGNASTALSIPHTSGTPGIYDVIIDGVPLAEVLQPCPQVPGLLCAPATIDLAGAEIELVPLVARENRLRRALEVYLAEQDEPVDLVIIDCPPSLGLLTVNAFVAAREVMIPIQCEYYALEGLSQLMKNVELIQQHLNAALRISTILLTMYDGRTRLAADVADQVREYFGDRVLRTAVPRSVRVSEAPSHGETVMTYDPGSAGALSYAEAAAEMRRQEV